MVVKTGRTARGFRQIERGEPRESATAADSVSTLPPSVTVACKTNKRGPPKGAEYLTPGTQARL